jgi:ankyrin repeat protein
MDEKVLAMAWNKQWKELLAILVGLKGIVEWRLRANNGMSPLMLAVEAGEWEVGKEMLRLGAHVNEADANGQSALHVAACEGKVEAVRGLLRSGANPNAEDKGGVTPLMEACMGWEQGGGQFESAKELIDVGGKVNARTKAGEGALFYACGAESEELVGLLLEAGGSLGSHEKVGVTGWRVRCAQ